jgi:hypothetical protein
MLRRLLLLALLASLAVQGVAAHAVGVEVHLFPFTREVRLHNDDEDPFEFIFYSLTSPSGALNGADGVWTSISDTYDASGNGFIDPVNNWVEIKALATELTEGLFVGTTPGSLAPLRSIGLGNIWNPETTQTPDVTAAFRKPDEQPALVSIEYAIDGDYNEDLTVNESDYNLWNMFFNDPYPPSADGNHNGILDAADYTVWRDNYGTTFTGTAFAAKSEVAGAAASLASAAVPEPSAFWLFISALVGLSLTGMRQFNRLRLADVRT